MPSSQHRLLDQVSTNERAPDAAARGARTRTRRVATMPAWKFSPNFTPLFSACLRAILALNANAKDVPRPERVQMAEEGAVHATERLFAAAGLDEDEGLIFDQLAGWLSNEDDAPVCAWLPLLHCELL